MAKHRSSAKQLLSPETPITSDSLVIEISRALKRVQKGLLMGREQILAELAPSATRIHKAAEALEKRRDAKPVRVALRVDDLDDEAEEAVPPDEGDLGPDDVDNDAAEVSP